MATRERRHWGVFSGVAFLLLLVVGVSTGTRAWADYGPAPFYDFGAKQDEKSKNRWSLSDWLETRDRIRLMDLWLAIHSPSPYEYFIGGNYRFGLTNTDPTAANGGRWDAYAGAFASIVGLEVHYAVPGDSGEYRFSGLLDLRIFGFHDQATNITLQGGMRQVNAWPDSYHNPLFGGRLTFYLSRLFGIGGLWHHYFSATANSGLSYSGDRIEGTGFIDFRAVRVFATYFSEPQTTDNGAGGISTLTRQGIELGTQLYF